MSKRNRTPFTLKCKAKEAPALKKYRADVLNFSKSTDDPEKHNAFLKKDTTFSRKQKRKEERKLKKARRHAFRCGKQVFTQWKCNSCSNRVTLISFSHSLLMLVQRAFSSMQTMDLQD